MADQETPKTIRFHNVKSNFFRVVYADGAVGGPTPRGQIQIAFYSERFPIPVEVEHSLDVVEGDKAQLGDEISRNTRSGIIREIEVSVVMNLASAKSLYVWLDKHIKKLQGSEGDHDAS